MALLKRRTFVLATTTRAANKMTKPELIIQMRRVSDAMIALGLEMREYGVSDGHDGFHDAGIQLAGAGTMLAQWQSAAEKENNG